MYILESAVLEPAQLAARSSTGMLVRLGMRGRRRILTVGLHRCNLMIVSI